MREQSQWKQISPCDRTCYCGISPCVELRVADILRAQGCMIVSVATSNTETLHDHGCLEVLMSIAELFNTHDRRAIWS